MDFACRELEYNSIKKLLGRYLINQGALDLLESLKPICNRRELEDQHALNREIMVYLRDHQVLFSEIPSLDSVFLKLDLTGAILNVAEIKTAQNFLIEVESFRTRWKNDIENFSRLSAQAHKLPDLRDLNSLICKVIKGGEINEDYSPVLQGLRGRTEAARLQVHQKLDRIVKSPEFLDRLQDQLITIRSGRYVIPVRSEQKRNFEGIVHGSSSSGATVFMEPLDTLELNNELVRLAEENEREIQRILREVSGRIREDVENLHHAYAVWSEMELVFGICQFGKDFNCIIPTFSKKGLELEGIRHPLLEDNLKPEKKPVALNLKIDSSGRVLVISGPNAGGKTVVLKTLGIVSLMAQSGIPIPGVKVVLPILDRVLVDIGDQSSITNRLSTFSAHLLAIKQVIENATPNSLVLLDEIGSSTEPSEGAALAMAVLEHLRSIGCVTLASTHYNRVKMYAETNEGVRNAAMEFDRETLEATYKLIDGLSGSSSGLEIAQRSGLPSKLLADAQEMLEKGELQAAHYADVLRGRIEEIEKGKLALKAERREFQEWKEGLVRTIEEERKRDLEHIEERVNSMVANIREGAASELKRVSKESAESFKRKLEGVRVRSIQRIHQERPTMRKFKQSIEVRKRTPMVLRPGDQIRIVSLGLTGAVSRIQKDGVEVLLGNMKIHRPISDIEFVDEIDAKFSGGIHFDSSNKHLESTELNLIGHNAEEAVSLLDKFLDDALLSGVSMVRVVHGFGKGVLSKTVAEVLESHPHVGSFQVAPQSQGGGGATIAILKD